MPYIEVHIDMVLSFFFSSFPTIWRHNSTLAIIFSNCIVLEHFQYDGHIPRTLSEAGQFLQRPMRQHEASQLYAHLYTQVGQLMVLYGMWSAYKWYSLYRGLASVDCSDLSEILPRFGLLRGVYSLRHLFPSERGHYDWSNISVYIGAGALFSSVGSSILIYNFGIRTLRLATIILTLLYADMITVLLELYSTTVGVSPSSHAKLLQGFEEKPRLGVAAITLFYVNLWALVDERASPFLPINPLCIAGLLLYFLAHRHVPGRIADPLPAPKLPVAPEDRICRVCQTTMAAMLAQPKKAGRSSEGKAAVHHRRTRSFKQSAMQGCRICATAWHQLAMAKSTILSLLPWFCATELEFGFGAINMHYRWVRYLCTFDLLDVSYRDNAMLITQQELPDHTGSAQSLDLARSWLDKCQREHGECASDHDTGFRPSRLLYLGDPDHVCLHTSEDLPLQLRYMTLSHCWGTTRCVRLQQDNLDEFRRAVPEEALPQTFVDAIRVARHLGAVYLWIDSLCILQDSLADWDAEAAVMGHIYHNSSCNIAATTAHDSYQGCLYPRNPRVLQPEPLWISDADGKKRGGRYYLYNGTNVDDPYRLYTRAWVFQEALLSPRTLDCSRSQLFWLCDRTRASEEFPSGFPESSKCNHPTQERSKGPPEQTLRAMIANMRKAYADAVWRGGLAQQPCTLETFFRDNETQSCSPAKTWAKLVDTYSRMDLTFETDRAAALTGTIAAFRPFLGDYWAGMWEKLVPSHLCWKPTPPGSLEAVSHCTRPTVKRAPSWSWMSLEGGMSSEIQWLDHDYFVSLLRADVISSTDIRLRLRAPLVRATWAGDNLLTRAVRSVRRCPRLVRPETRLGVVRVETRQECMNWSFMPGAQDTVIINEYPEAKPGTVRVSFDVYAEELQARGKDIWLLVISADLKPEDDSEGHYMSGLVLKLDKSSTSSDDTFSRLGYFVAHGLAARRLANVNKSEFVLT